VVRDEADRIATLTRQIYAPLRVSRSARPDVIRGCHIRWRHPRFVCLFVIVQRASQCPNKDGRQRSYLAELDDAGTAMQDAVPVIVASLTRSKQVTSPTSVTVRNVELWRRTWRTCREQGSDGRGTGVCLKLAARIDELLYQPHRPAPPVADRSAVGIERNAIRRVAAGLARPRRGTDGSTGRSCPIAMRPRISMGTG
jgi:hypothetical protein